MLIESKLLNTHKNIFFLMDHLLGYNKNVFPRPFFIYFSINTEEEITICYNYLIIVI